MDQKEWFLYVVDHHEGPFTAVEIKTLVKKGEAKNSSFVWREGMADWVMMTDVTEFGPSGAKSDGHGPFAFLANLFPKKDAKPAAQKAESSVGVQAPQPTPKAAVDLGGINLNDVVWCLNSKRQFSGPFSLNVLLSKLNLGEITPKDSVWREGWTSFAAISDLPEFMSQVVELSADKPKQKKKVDAGSPAALMGFGGKVSVVKRRWYHSSAVRLVFLAAVFGTAYQWVVTGKLDSIFEKVPGAKEKVTALGLPAITFDGVTHVLSSATTQVLSLAQGYVGALPEPLASWFSPVQLPEGLAPQDIAPLRAAASADPKQGSKIAAALPPGDEMNPAFVIVGNVPDGTKLQVTLKGKEGTLLNATGYEKTTLVEINRRIGTTPRFVYEENKPLPKGQYSLAVREAGASAAEAKSNLDAFLGGRRDATYETRLKEYNERVANRLATETAELKQLALLLEQMANESATKFQQLIGMPQNIQRKNLWTQYHGQYAKLSAQVKNALEKITPEARKEYVLPQLYVKLEQTYQLTERLHQTETELLEKGGKIDGINVLAQQTADALNDLKTSIFKVIK